MNRRLKPHTIRLIGGTRDGERMPYQKCSAITFPIYDPVPPPWNHPADKIDLTPVKTETYALTTIWSDGFVDYVVRP